MTAGRTIDAAAHTQVDRAEKEPDMAFALNRDGPTALAEACSRAGIPLLHLSTDYVFDRTTAELYVEDDSTNRLSVYGASKAAGEEALQNGKVKRLGAPDWLLADYVGSTLEGQAAGSAGVAPAAFNTLIH